MMLQQMAIIEPNPITTATRITVLGIGCTNECARQPPTVLHHDHRSVALSIVPPCPVGLCKHHRAMGQFRHMLTSAGGASEELVE